MRFFGMAFLEQRKDFNALNRVDTQVGVETHIQFEHVARVTRFLGYDFEEFFGQVGHRGRTGDGSGRGNGCTRRN